MAVLDTPLRKAAQSVLRVFGQSVTFTDPGTATFDPATNTVVAGATATTVQAVVTEFSTRELGGVIQHGDRKVLVAASAITPTVAMALTIGDRRHDVVDVQAVYSGDQVAVYVVAARGV